MLKFLLSALAAIILVGCTPTVPAVSYSQLRDATWQLHTGENGVCSAVQITKTTLLTAAHCKNDNMSVAGRKAVILKVDESKDLMLLFVPGLPGNGIPLASKAPSVDSEVVVVGFPLGLGEVLTEGRVQSFIINPEIPSYVMLMTAPIVFGNSGGPMFVKENGVYKVAGIVSAVAVANLGFFPNLVTHLGFAVKLEAIKEFLK